MSVRAPARAVAFIAIACGTVLFAACPQQIARSQSAIDRDAEAYVRVVLALAERDPDSLDSYFGPPAWQADARAQHLSLADVQQAARGLLQRIATHEGSRYEFLARQVRAVAARIDVRAGVRHAFAEESRLLFGVDPPPVDRKRMVSVRTTLDRLLPGRGDLTRRLADFERRFIVSPDRLPQVLARAVAECRTVTLRHIALPADERVEVTFVRESAWPAFTRYSGDHRSSITVNATVALTVDDLLQLACHEAYPGHHTINVLVDDRLVRAEKRPELTVQFLFSPQALLAEGAASFAPQVAFSTEERIEFERAALFPLAGIDPRDAELAVRVSQLLDELTPLRTEIAARYVDGDLEFARAAASLERDALMPSPDAMLKFLNEYRAYASAYARGPELAAKYLDAHASPTDRAARWRAYAELVTNPSQSFEK